MTRHQAVRGGVGCSGAGAVDGAASRAAELPEGDSLALPSFGPFAALIAGDVIFGLVVVVARIWR